MSLRGNNHGRGGVTPPNRGRVILPLRALCLGIAFSVSGTPAPAHAQALAQLRLLQSDANRVVLELELAGYDARTQTIDGATYTALSIPGLGHTGEAGKPQLPIQGALVGIPPGAQASLKILADESSRGGVTPPLLTFPPLPVPTPRVQFDPAQPLPRYAGHAFTRDAGTYSANQFYPADAARIASDSAWRSQRVLVVEFHPLQYNPVTRQLLFHRRLRVEIAFSYPRGQTREALGAPLNEGAFEVILQRALVNYASAKNWRARRPVRPSRPDRSATSSGPWYKIAISADGIYKITCAQLASAGVDLGSLDPSTLKIYKQGTELAIDAVGLGDGICNNDDYLLFWGQAVNTTYANTNVYWLTHDGTAGKRVTTRDGSGTGTTPTTFTNTMHLEQNLLYRSYIPWAEDAEHWFWNYLPDSYDRDGNGDPNSVDYAFTIDHLATGTYSASLKVTLFGFNTGAHRTPVYLNGNLIDDTTWSGKTERSATITFPHSYLQTGTNTLRVAEIQSGSFVLVNYFDLSYASPFDAVNNALRFRQTTSGTWRYQITGLATSDAQVFDIGDPFNVARFITTTITPGGSYTLQFADTITAPRQYIALTPSQYQSPASLRRDTASNLSSSSNGADYIIIAPSAFIPNVQSLANHRAAQGLRVRIIDVQDVYDEFSDGLQDAQALRDFLAYAHANWQPPAPAFALLVGDGTFDPKGNCATPGACWQDNITTPPNSNRIPPYLRFVDPWVGETASDNRLVAFDDGAGNTLPHLAIGRLPAETTADVDAMVAKTLNYEQNPPSGRWRSTMAFVADNAYQPNGTPDAAGNFWAFSDALAGDPHYMPASLTADRIYYNPCDGSVYPQCALPYPPYTTPESVRRVIVTAINDGRLIVNYIGHSGIQWWAHESLFRFDEVNALVHAGKFPVMLAMTCYDGYFHFPGLPSLAETNVRAVNKGALASWSASGLGVASGHDLLDKGFFDAVMRQGVRQIGSAAVLGKVNLWTNGGGANRDLIDTFNLLGDPASRLQIQFPFHLPLIFR